MNFGEFIMQKREALGITRNALSSKTNISRTEIVRIEEGMRKQPSINNLRLLSKALSVNYLQMLFAADYITEDDLNAWTKDKVEEKLTLIKNSILGG